MPIFLALAGILLIVAGVKGKEKDLLAQIADDGKNFVVWFLLILIVGFVGMNKTTRPISNAFFVLIIVGFALRSGGAIITGFKQLTQGV